MACGKQFRVWGKKVKEIADATPDPIQSIEIKDIGVGTQRASGTYIGMLLQLESEHDRAMIIADVMKALNIPLDAVIEAHSNDS